MKYNTILKSAMLLNTDEKQNLTRELMKMIVKECGQLNKINAPELAFLEVKDMDIDYEQEQFIVIALNGANEVIGKVVATKGLLNSSQIHPRETFKWAIRNNAASIILAHNHPSGNTEPSREDISVTEKLLKAGELLGINVLDHVIFTENNFYSMLENNKI